MGVNYIKDFDEYQDGESDKPEPARDEITDPGRIRAYIKSGEPFCILSAYNPDDSPETNALNHETLEKDTLKSRYAYHLMAFRYRCLQNGQMVKAVYRSLFVPKMPLHIGLDLAMVKVFSYYPETTNNLGRKKFMLIPAG